MLIIVSVLSMTVVAQRGSWLERQFRPRPPLNRRTTTTTAAPSAPGADDCPCVTLQQYNPVCGTDGVTYSNPQKLNCARSCGRGEFT
ncbi:unnamed protein product, partial [Timema podura]|nr:unnamed protein product [Timema podura]